MSTTQLVAADDTPIELILPTTGKVFYEQKSEYRLCQPHLMPLKSLTLKKLETMQLSIEQAKKRTQEARSQEATN